MIAAKHFSDPMRYCYNCNRITVGKPLFCNFCGRTYNVKLCPRLHVNPRSADICSQCGSRDLSAPQPKVPFWAPVLEFMLSLVPGVILTVFSVVAVAFSVIQLLQRPGLLLAFVMLACALGVLWWAWTLIPHWIRNAIYKMLKRKRDGGERRGGR